MFTSSNEQNKSGSTNQAAESKTVAEQPAAPRFAIDFAKLQREGWRLLGNILKVGGSNGAPYELEVQKARLFEAIVRQHKLDVQKELNVTLDVWRHRALLKKYAQDHGYLGDASHMFSIENQLNKNVLQGPKIILNTSAQRPIVSSIEHKEAAAVVQRPAVAPQRPTVKKPVERVVDYQKIAEIMKNYRENELRKIEKGQDTMEAVLRRLAPYEKIEENVKRQAQAQQETVDL